MSCPDNLLVGYRDGVLGAEDAARLDAHLAQCPSCRLSLRVGQDFDAVLQTQAGDELIAARFARNLAPKLVKERADKLRYAWVAAALLAVVASAGLAAAAQLGWSFERHVRETRVEPSKESRLHKPQESSAAREAALPAAPAVVEPELAPEPEPAPQIEAHGQGELESAAALFREANERRRAGEQKSAQRLYRALQKRYPRSREVEVSRVSLGRVELELGDARAALAQFERYLAQQVHGPLAEEALFGKASALARLGRSRDERRTWDTLLATFPSSIYADRARMRLQTLLVPGSERDHTP